MKIGSNILEYLKEKGISQTFLARQTGIPMGKLNPALHGKRRLTAEEYEVICNALEVPPQRFFCGDKAQTKEKAALEA